MKFRDKNDASFKEKHRQPRERFLCDTMRYWGFQQAADNIDFRREHIDVETAIASWVNYPKCMDEYPALITKKPKLDPKEEALVV